MLLTNPYAAELKGTDSWIHVSHLKKAPIGGLKLKISKEQKQTASE